jgi:hypothetical protein
MYSMFSPILFSWSRIYVGEQNLNKVSPHIKGENGETIIVALSGVKTTSRERKSTIRAAISCIKSNRHRADPSDVRIQLKFGKIKKHMISRRNLSNVRLYEVSDTRVACDYKLSTNLP